MPDLEGYIGDRKLDKAINLDKKISDILKKYFTDTIPVHAYFKETVDSDDVLKDLIQNAKDPVEELPNIKVYKHNSSYFAVISDGNTKLLMLSGELKL